MMEKKRYEPAVKDLQLETVLGALAGSLRLTIIRIGAAQPSTPRGFRPALPWTAGAGGELVSAYRGIIAAR